MTGTIAERVAAGAAFLDEEQPNWWALIDLDTFWIGSSCNCVLGQLYGSYGRAAQTLSILWRTADLGFYWASNSADEEKRDAEIDALTAAWRKVIETRRAAP